MHSLARRAFRRVRIPSGNRSSDGQRRGPSGSGVGRGQVGQVGRRIEQTDTRVRPESQARVRVPGQARTACCNATDWQGPLRSGRHGSWSVLWCDLGRSTADQMPDRVAQSVEQRTLTPESKKEPGAGRNRTVPCACRSLLEPPQSLCHHNAAGNGLRDGPKRRRIGQSAGKGTGGAPVPASETRRGTPATAMGESRHATLFPEGSVKADAVG